MKILRYLLMPFALIYGGCAALRRALYERHWLHPFKARVPTIGIGNLAVGGTGKTPHTAFITKLLSQHFHTAMLSRGYGRKTKGYISANDYPSEPVTSDIIGDEPLLLHQRFPDIPMAVDADRKEGILKILTGYPDTEVIVLDDVLQHLSVQPSCRILLTEYARPYSTDFPMPAGNLREFRRASSVADLVIVTKTNVSKESINKEQWRKQLRLKTNQPLFFTRYVYEPPKPVTEAAFHIAPSSQTTVVLLTGIAHPEPLRLHLQKDFPNILPLNYPDHHHFTIREIERLRQCYFTENQTNVVLFTTEKDWMRLQSEALKKVVSLLPIFILPIQVDFVFEEDKKIFTDIIENYVRRKTQEN